MYVYMKEHYQTRSDRSALLPVSYLCNYFNINAFLARRLHDSTHLRGMVRKKIPPEPKLLPRPRFKTGRTSLGANLDLRALTLDARQDRTSGLSVNT